MSDVIAPPLLLEEHTTTDIAQGWVANPPSPMPSDAGESATLVPTVSACARSGASPTFETTGDPSPSVGERLIYWSSRRGIIRGGRFPPPICKGTPREAEAPRRCVNTGKGLSRPTA